MPAFPGLVLKKKKKRNVVVEIGDIVCANYKLWFGHERNFPWCANIAYWTQLQVNLSPL